MSYGIGKQSIRISNSRFFGDPFVQILTTNVPSQSVVTAANSSIGSDFRQGIRVPLARGEGTHSISDGRIGRTS